VAERVEEILRKAVERLEAAGVEAALDARLLLQAIAGVSHADILAGRMLPLSADVQARFEAAIARRAAHEPVHRILGRREFYGLSLALSPDTLEPRPDTEALVDLVLPYIQRAAKTAGANEQITLLDIGTGSGAIALALLGQIPQLYAIGADISAGALRTAQANAEALGLAERFQITQSDCFSAIMGKYDFIVSNPPYIPHGEIAGLSAEVRLYDPLCALDGGADGLDFYLILAAESAAHLKPGGMVAVEAGINQAADVIEIFAAHGFRHIATAKDLSGIDRALLFAL